MNHEWKERPKGFLADYAVTFNDERLDYIVELHQVIWKLLKVIGISWSGTLKDCVTATLNSISKKNPNAQTEMPYQKTYTRPEPTMLPPTERPNNVQAKGLSQEEIAEVYAKKKYDYPSSPDTLAGHVYQRGWLDCFEYYKE